MKHVTRRPATAGIAVAAAVGLLAACTPPIRFATGQKSPSPGISTPAPRGSSTPATGASPVPAPAGSGALAQFPGDIRRVIDSVNPSVVQVETASGLGSGVVLDGNGDIVTNAHVVGAETKFTVTTHDGQTLQASLVGTYPGNDLAVIRVTGDVSLPPARWADSSQLHLGDFVLAIGSPLGLTDSISEGIVSGLARQQPEGNGVTLNDLIQTTAALNPGNSGGALVDITGSVVGIPTLSGGSGRGGTASNIGFAIPSNQVKTITGQITGGGSVTHTGQPYIGVSVSDAASGGAQVESVVSGGPADKAGIKTGWVITGVNGSSVSSGAGLSAALANFKPGDQVKVSAKLPDGSSRTVSVTVGERPVTP